MPSQYTKILEFNQFQKSDKASFIIYVDLVGIENTDGCKDNPENLSRTKASEHISSGFSMSTILSTILEAQKIRMMYTEVIIA